MRRFVGKVVFVTGASSGLSPEMAAMFAAERARVVLAARRVKPIRDAAAGIGESAIAVQPMSLRKPMSLPWSISRCNVSGRWMC